MSIKKKLLLLSLLLKNEKIYLKENVDPSLNILNIESNLSPEALKTKKEKEDQKETEDTEEKKIPLSQLLKDTAAKAKKEKKDPFLAQLDLYYKLLQQFGSELSEIDSFGPTLTSEEIENIPFRNFRDICTTKFEEDYLQEKTRNSIRYKLDLFMGGIIKTNLENSNHKIYKEEMKLNYSPKNKIEEIESFRLSTYMPLDLGLLNIAMPENLDLKKQEQNLLKSIDIRKIIYNFGLEKDINQGLKKNISNEMKEKFFSLLQHIEETANKVRYIESFVSNYQFSLTLFYKFLMRIDIEKGPSISSDLFDDSKSEKKIRSIHAKGLLSAFKNLVCISKITNEKALYTFSDTGTTNFNELKKKIAENNFHDRINQTKLEEAIREFLIEQELINLEGVDFKQFMNNNPSTNEKFLVDDNLKKINSFLFNPSFLNYDNIEKKKVSFSKMGNLALKKFNTIFNAFDKILNEYEALSEMDTLNSLLKKEIEFITSLSTILPGKEDYMFNMIYKGDTTSLTFSEYLRSIGSRVINGAFKRNDNIKIDNTVEFINMKNLPLMFNNSKQIIDLSFKPEVVTVDAPPGTGKSQLAKTCGINKVIYDTWGKCIFSDEITVSDKYNPKKTFYIIIKNQGEIIGIYPRRGLSNNQTNQLTLERLTKFIEELRSKYPDIRIIIVCDETLSGGNPEAGEITMNNQALKKLLSYYRVLSAMMIEHSKDTRSKISKESWVYNVCFINNSNYGPKTIDEQMTKGVKLNIVDENAQIINNFVNQDQHEETKIYFEINKQTNKLMNITKENYYKKLKSGNKNLIEKSYKPIIEDPNKNNELESNVLYNEENKTIIFRTEIITFDLDSKQCFAFIDIIPSIVDNQIVFTANKEYFYFFEHNLESIIKNIILLKHWEGKDLLIRQNSKEFKGILNRILANKNEDAIKTYISAENVYLQNKLHEEQKKKK